MPVKGGHISEYNRAKLLASRLGSHHTEEAKQKMRDARLGIPRPDLRGKKRSAEVVAKMSADRLGKPNSKLRGRKYSPETIAKMRAAHLGKKLTTGQKRKIGDSLRGAKSYMWKGGVTKEHFGLRAAITSMFQYRQWRSDIFTRDNFTCQCCGKHDGSCLHAHHIKSFRTILNAYNITTVDEAITCEELWSINNGVTLCVKCHGARHKKIRAQNLNAIC